MSPISIARGASAAPQQAGPIRVMLVDNHQIVLWGLEKLIDGERPRMQVVAKATNGLDAIQLARQTMPDVVVLDLELTGENGSEVIPALVDELRIRVLILTGMRDPKLRETAILLGACGIVDKQEPVETILKAIDKVHRGELWLDRSTTGRIFVELARPKAASAADPDQQKIASLTARERAIVGELLRNSGTDSRRLAEKLGMGEHTLRNHLSRIYDKLGVSNRLELYLFGQKHGLNSTQQSTA